MWCVYYTVEAGTPYTLEGVIGEQPGGSDFATLLQEVEGVTYDKDPKGNPIPPVLRMSNVAPALTGQAGSSRHTATTARSGRRNPWWAATTIPPCKGIKPRPTARA